jgi:hypothetical protein
LPRRASEPLAIASSTSPSSFAVAVIIESIGLLPKPLHAPDDREAARPNDGPLPIRLRAPARYYLQVEI